MDALLGGATGYWQPQEQHQQAAAASKKIEIPRERLTDEEFDRIVVETSARLSKNATRQCLVASNGADSKQCITSTTLGPWRVTPPPPLAQVSAQEVAPIKLSQPKRPMNAFMVWGQAIRRELHNRYSNVQNALLSKALGRVWKKLDLDEKEPYISRANIIKTNHKRDYPDYRYQPRRIQEKQRRIQQITNLQHHHHHHHGQSAANIQRPPSKQVVFSRPLPPPPPPPLPSQPRDHIHVNRYGNTDHQAPTVAIQESSNHKKTQLTDSATLTTTCVNNNINININNNYQDNIQLINYEDIYKYNQFAQTNSPQWNNSDNCIGAYRSNAMAVVKEIDYSTYDESSSHYLTPEMNNDTHFNDNNSKHPGQSCFESPHDRSKLFLNTQQRQLSFDDQQICSSQGHHDGPTHNNVFLDHPNNQHQSHQSASDDHHAHSSGSTANVMSQDITNSSLEYQFYRQQHHDLEVQYHNYAESAMYPEQEKRQRRTYTTSRVAHVDDHGYVTRQVKREPSSMQGTLE